MELYLLINIIFLTVTMMILRITTFSRHQAITLIGLLILTAVFDSIIVGLSIVDYNVTKILGVYIGNAPIEDFFYAIFAAVIIPTLWHRFDTRRKKP